MKSSYFLACATLTLTTFSISFIAKAQDVLTGDTRLACEAILCLSSGTTPSECSPSLRRYFSISYRSFSNTIRGRINFLNLCPVSSQTPQMRTLVDAIANGAGRCDAASLNATLLIWESDYTYISDRLPDYCTTYIGHQYTDLQRTTPKYINGAWVDSNN